MNRPPLIALLSPAVGTGNLGDHLIETAIRRLLRDGIVYRRFSIRRPLRAPDIDAINGCKCALICGTNLYQHDWHSALTPELLARIRVPVIPFGVGGSAARLEDRRVSAATRRMIRILHDACALGSVRDPHSAEVVAGAGVTNVVVTGCPVLFWAGGDTLPPILRQRRTHVVVSVRNWLMHRWPNNVDHPVQIGLIRRLLEAFPADRLVFPIHETYDLRLVESLGIPPGMVFRSRNVADYARLYGDRTNIVLALRLHAGMLALARGVPAVFVGHDTRTYSFCRMMGIECIDLFAEDCADRCITRVETLLKDDSTPFAGTQPRYRRLRTDMTGFLAANGLPARPAAPAGGARFRN